MVSILDDVVKLFEELRVLFLVPNFVSALDPVLHLIERLLEHGGEVGVHRLNVLVQFLDVIVLLLLFLALRVFNLFLFLFESLDLLHVLVDAVLELSLVLTQLLVC